MKVLHIIDSLAAGGAERVSVNLVNGLNKAGVEAYLCVTRAEGPLKTFVVRNDRYLFLQRTKTFDLQAIRKLIRYIKAHQITIVHAHSSSFFTAVIARLLTRVKLVWHDHYGLSERLHERNSFVLRAASYFFDFVFSVNHTLVAWAQKKLLVEASRIQFLPNYPDLGEGYKPTWNVHLLAKRNILCLANLRPQKDHDMLLHAFELVQREFPDVSLELVGKDMRDAYSDSIRELVNKLQIKNVFFRGEQTHVVSFLNGASVGVLSSSSEGLPLALLEYGKAGLPVICTNVGECGKVLQHQQTGWLVPPSRPEVLAEAIKEAFLFPERSAQYASHFHQHIETAYSDVAIVDRITHVYNSIR